VSQACPEPVEGCHGPMAVIAFIEAEDVLEKILKHLGLWELTPRHVCVRSSCHEPRNRNRHAAWMVTSAFFRSKRRLSVKLPLLQHGASSHLRRNPPKQLHLRQPPPLKLWRSRGYGGYPFRIHPRRSGRGFLRRRVNLGLAPPCVPSGLYQPGTPPSTAILQPLT